MTNYKETSWPFPVGNYNKIFAENPLTHISNKIKAIMPNRTKTEAIVRYKTDTEVASEKGVRFIHLHDEVWNTYVTVAYRPHNQQRVGNFVEVAVAYKHPNDTHCKKTGAAVAAQRFLAGKTVLMPLRGDTYWQTYENFYDTFVGVRG